MKEINNLLRDLFYFSIPAISKMEVIDLVVAEHALLMLLFSFRKKYSVLINS